MQPHSTERYGILDNEIDDSASRYNKFEDYYNHVIVPDENYKREQILEYMEKDSMINTTRIINLVFILVIFTLNKVLKLYLFRNMT